jgi:hypothetical protein
MPAINKVNLLNDLRKLYDVQDDQKAGKLDLYVRKTINEITKAVSGSLTTKKTKLSVVSGKATFPTDMEVPYALFLGSTEVMPLNVHDYMTFQNQTNMGSPYGLVQVENGDYVINLTGVANGTNVLDLAYKAFTDAVETIPALWYYIVLDGASYLYEKYEKKLSRENWSSTQKKFEDALQDMQIRFCNAESSRHYKYQYTDLWTSVLSHI